MWNKTFNTTPTAYNGSVSMIEIDFNEVVRNLVKDIDKTIILCIFFIFFGYFLQKIFLPRALIGLKDMRSWSNNKNWLFVLDYVIDFVNFGISLSETFILGGAIFIFGIAYIKGIIPFYVSFPTYFMLGFTLLLFVGEIIGFFVKKRYKNILPYLYGLEKRLNKNEKKGGLI